MSKRTVPGGDTSKRRRALYAEAVALARRVESLLTPSEHGGWTICLGVQAREEGIIAEPVCVRWGCCDDHGIALLGMMTYLLSMQQIARERGLGEAEAEDSQGGGTEVLH